MRATIERARASQRGYEASRADDDGAPHIREAEPMPDVQARDNRDLQRPMRRTVWLNGGCRSWYLDANGRNTTLWPRSTWTFRRLTRRFDPASYRLVARPEAVRASGALASARSS